MFTKLRSINKISIAILAASLILQFYSLIRRYPDEPKCGRLVEPFNPFNVLINCDSAVFMKDADNPERLFDGTSDYQDRPASALINSLLTRLLRLVNFPEKIFPVTGISGETYNYSSTVYIIFILLNAVVFSASVVLIVRAFSDPGSANRQNQTNVASFLLLAVSVLAANELTKTFFWTPHSQMFNILQPALAIYLIMSLHTINTTKRFFKFSFLLLLLTFFYPSIALLAVLLLFAPFRSIYIRFAIVLITFLTYASYPFLLDFFGGEYRSNAIQKFREFIWVWDSIKLGNLDEALLQNGRLFLATFPTIPTLFMIFTLILIFIFNPKLIQVNFKRTLLSPTSFFIATYASYLFFIGFYSRRLTLGFVIFLELLLILYLFRNMPLRLERYAPWFSGITLIFISASWFFSSGPLV